MDESQEKIIKKTLSSVKPYLNHPTELENKVEKVSEGSSSLEEAREEIEELISEEEDPSKKTDYRILINKLRDK